LRTVIAVAGWVIALTLAAVLYFRAAPASIDIGAVRQDVRLDPLPMSASSQPLMLLDAVNAYRTAPGWIASSNARIYAGLVDRVWSAPYAVQQPYRHAISVWGGAGAGVSYTYAIFDRWTLGGMVLYSSGSPGMLAGVGYRW